jgi:Pentapeptide repeats (8 copies)
MVRLESFTPKRTWWDRCGVIFQGFTAIAIPISALALYLSVEQFKAQQTTATQDALTQQYQGVLSGYLDDMSSLVLNYRLTSSRAGAPVRALAVARTDTAVRNLDGPRKGTLIRYLWEAGLISEPHPIVDLFQADLTDADFPGANLFNVDLAVNDLGSADFAWADLSDADLNGAGLHEADLSGANLSGAKLSCTYVFGVHEFCADLTGANLSDANLTDADLRGANLRGAVLRGADLRGAAYNASSARLKNSNGAYVILPPTQWPEGFGHHAT